jgi:hypothetical protein
MADLNAAAPSGNAGAVTTTGDAGNVSDDFVKAKADRAVTEGTRLTGIAREIAKTRAPNLQLVTEGQRGADLAGNLQSLYGSNSNMGRATANDANSVLEPQYGGLGKIATLIGGAMAGGQIAKQAASTKAGGGINFAPQGDVYR